MEAAARAASGRSGINGALPLYFGLVACSWAPHWACHYYRLETGSSFVVGGWSATPAASLIALGVYGGFIAVCLLAIVHDSWRGAALMIAGVGHTSLGVLHLSRLFVPFDFEVFGWNWSVGASLREAVASLAFGLFSLLLLRRIRARRRLRVGDVE